ncbi:hypothetical protein [Streptomyces malaysiensis]|uniref:AMP-binding enzyme C-terminal domain-containing protein n=1 Tax=Streptomyces malaysiensis subsp. samsunensis TaxID=459658 RepID=A0A9X2LWV8_STRMQ|nr:hypothetical protein [Streptomyces samsunensis]MCQ8832130.1 hypothetical protein [Streptomyces samsunensis]
MLSSVVVGLPDDDLGQRAHAIVQAEPGTTARELLDFLVDRLVRYKIPGRSSSPTGHCATTPARCAAAGCATSGSKG